MVGCSFRQQWTQHGHTQSMGANFAFWRETLPCRQTQALRIFGSTAAVSPISSSSVPAQNFSSKCASKASLFVFTSLNGVRRRGGWMDDGGEGGMEREAAERFTSAAPPLDAPLQRTDHPGPRPPRDRAMRKTPLSHPPTLMSSKQTRAHKCSCLWSVCVSGLGINRWTLLLNRVDKWWELGFLLLFWPWWFLSYSFIYSLWIDADQSHLLHKLAEARGC